MANFVVLRRTLSEIDAFGGEVFVDIDGKRAGTVQLTNLEFNLSVGKHTIKMYKSHKMGSFIGVTETTIEINENEQLYARYSPPLVIDQPGNIVIAPFNSELELDNIVNEIEKQVKEGYTEQTKQTTAKEKKTEEKSIGCSSGLLWLGLSLLIIGLSLQFCSYFV